MSRYLVMLLAVLIGAAIGLWLARRNRQSETTLVEEKPPRSLLPWVAGLTVLIIGLMLIANHERASIDTDYRPATIDNGSIRPGQFNQPGGQ